MLKLIRLFLRDYTWRFAILLISPAADRLAVFFILKQTKLLKSLAAYVSLNIGLFPRNSSGHKKSPPDKYYVQNVMVTPQVTTRPSACVYQEWKTDLSIVNSISHSDVEILNE